MFTSCANNGKTIKIVDQLTENEKLGMDALMEQIYTDAGASFFYETTYNSVPLEDGSFGEKLETPLVLFSGASIGPHMLEKNTLDIIKNEMQTKAIHWEKYGKKYDLFILDGYLIQDPGGAGGSMYTGSNDMVTIFPTKIEIEEK